MNCNFLGKMPHSSNIVHKKRKNMDWNIIKEEVAAVAARKIPASGMIGLGSGSTSKCFIKVLSEIYAASHPNIHCVATSQESEDYARSLGLPMIAMLDWSEPVDVTFDGADAIDEEGTAIKGAGAALLREKIVAFSSQKLILMVDERKWKKPWHEVVLPLEVLHFGLQIRLRAIRSMGVHASVRMNASGTIFTADRNCIIDVAIPPKADLMKLDAAFHQIPGVVETGLFYHFASEIIIGYGNGLVEELQVQNDSRIRPSIF
jgi:ribose 5-phosphate isomerase A